MKKTILKLFAVIGSVVIALSCASCDAFFEQVDSLLDKVSVKLAKVIDGLDYILDNFSDLTNPIISEDGVLYDEWVGTELSEDFVCPETLVSFETGYVETNEKGTLYTNLVTLGGVEDMDAYVQYLRSLGYGEYNEGLSWTFYNTMRLMEMGKLCMALTKDGVFVEVAFYENEGYNAVFTFADYDVSPAFERETEEEGDDEQDAPTNVE